VTHGREALPRDIGSLSPMSISDRGALSPSGRCDGSRGAPQVERPSRSRLPRPQRDKTSIEVVLDHLSIDDRFTAFHCTRRDPEELPRFVVSGAYVVSSTRSSWHHKGGAQFRLPRRLLRGVEMAQIQPPTPHTGRRGVVAQCGGRSDLTTEAKERYNSNVG
jgi:hypothetical protein